MDEPNQLVQSKMDKLVIMANIDELAELLVLIAPEINRDHLTTRRKTLHVKSLNVMFGLLNCVALFCDKWSNNLIIQCFRVNLCDSCAFNKEVNETQFVASWHAKKWKMSHAKEAELDKCITHIKSNYQDENIVEVETSCEVEKMDLWGYICVILVLFLSLLNF